METKPIWLSKTIWGAGLTIAAVFLTYKGIEVSGEEKQLVIDQIEIVTAGLVSLSGIFMTIWGRLTAKKPVSLTGAAKQARGKLPTIILLALVGSSTTACSTSPDPMVNYADTQEAFISTTTVLIDAKALGHFSDEDWTVKILPLINRGDRLLDDMKSEAIKGNSPAVEFILGNLKSTLRQLLIQEALLKQRTSTDGSSYRSPFDFHDPGDGGFIDSQFKSPDRESLSRLHRQTRRVA